ncbi:MAG: DoxX family protein [Opitutae bacterium]|nr:DoxX family protein [Opitutae bacterium]
MTLSLSRQTSTPLRWTGRILSGLAIAALLLDASAKLVPLQPVMEGMVHLGFKNQTPEFARMIGGLLMGCTALYAIPRTAVLGAILLTGFLGGTIAIHLRLGHPLFSHVLFGGYIGVLVWVGLGLRNMQVWRLFLPPRPVPLAPTAVESTN